jgi:aminopeptidase N
LTIALLALAHVYEPSHQDPNWKQFTDEFTFSNINDIRTQHYDLELGLDFDRRVVTGKQSLVMQTQQFGVKEVRLDISYLTIINVTDYYGNHLNYTIQDPNPELGQLLSINIPTKWFPYEKYVINITYETSPDAGALSWLNKEQTAGKNLPYTFIQCESIYC